VALPIIYRVVDRNLEAPPAAPSVLRSGLAGSRVLVTGVTGFLGTALFARLLADFPETHVTLLVRGRFGSRPQNRVDELAGGNVLGPWRERVGTAAIRRAMAERVAVLEGDVTAEIPALPSDIDVVFHCAATVSFDPPIEQAFQTNVLGARRLYEAVLATGNRPHLVHVSTAYVAGVTKGVVPEAPLEHQVDWRLETDAAMGARDRVEEASRKPEMLDRFMAKARREHGRSGPRNVARAAEELRRGWVEKRLVQYGRARAQTLGWPDVYTFTKAMGERAAEEISREDGLPLSIVRPSIIESSLLWPYPGWIEGFKMAEPIILAFGRGAIPDFPGLPESISDLIPVDLVINAMLAIAATGPDDHGPSYYHVSSGSRNPLTYLGLYELIRDYFRMHPMPERGRGAVQVPEWTFPGKRRVEARLRTGEKLLDAVDRAISKLPRSARVRSMVRRIDRDRGRLEFLRRYADLYGAYVEAEVIYTDGRTLDLYRSLPEVDRQEFVFDSAMIDWRHYLQDVHCPAVTLAMRFPSPARPDPRVRLRPNPNGVVAVFDMDGTLVDSNVVESYLWLRLAELPRESWPFETASVLRGLPRYVAAERRDRGEFLRSFYGRYAGASVEGIGRLIDGQVGELVLRRLSPAAVRRIREHRSGGHRTVLITGALDCFVRPLEPLFDHIVSIHLEQREGRYTGNLEVPPLVGEARAAWLRQFAVATGADLKASYAYADSHSDLPLLRAVGNPVAVNPDVSLFRVARSRRWPIEDWGRVKGTPRVLLPEPVP
jgi:fatty acyl-CoA reductase